MPLDLDLDRALDRWRGKNVIVTDRDANGELRAHFQGQMLHVHPSAPSILFNCGEVRLARSNVTDTHFDGSEWDDSLGGSRKLTIYERPGRVVTIALASPARRATTEPQLAATGGPPTTED